MQVRTESCHAWCSARPLLPLQRARLVSDQGEEIASGLARLELGPPLTVTLRDLEPVAPLTRAVNRGQRDFHLELEDGLSLPSRVIGSSGVVGRRRVCFLQVLAAPVACYCAAKA
jgi:hypothetical protein